MDVVFGILGACNVVKKAEKDTDEDASDVQLNAFEFRNYRTSLEDPQQKLLERIVNQTAASLVKGKTLKVNNYEDKVWLDKDLLVLEYNGEFFPLRTITKLEFFKDTDDMMGAPWVMEFTFEGRDVERSLIFNFEQERSRLNFALTIRILRTRDPALDINQAMEVVFQEDEDEEPEHKTFNRIVSTQHYNIFEAGIPIIFSVSDLKLYQKLQSTSRHVYLEFFVRYPNQDRFLYAKSPTTHIPPQVMQTEDTLYKRKKDKKDEEEDDKNKKAADKEGKPEALCAMRFDLKNVKLKVPKVPHQIFGRLMAKDDYFPTAVGTFDFKVDKTFLQDRRSMDPDEKAKERGGKDDSKKDPEAIGIPMFSAMKVAAKPSGDVKTAQKEENKIVQIGQLNIRILGYVTDSEKEKKPKKKAKKHDSEDADQEESEEEEEDEESEEGDNG